MWRMPGRSHAGPLAALTETEGRLRDQMRAHVTILADAIGERNVEYRYANLEAAAQYVERQFCNIGYQPAAQEFHAAGRTVRNIEVELPGGKQPDQILIVGAHYDSVHGSPAANDNA